MAERALFALLPFGLSLDGFAATSPAATTTELFSPYVTSANSSSRGSADNCRGWPANLRGKATRTIRASASVTGQWLSSIPCDQADASADAEAKVGEGFVGDVAVSAGLAGLEWGRESAGTVSPDTAQLQRHSVTCGSTVLLEPYRGPRSLGFNVVMVLKPS